MRVAPAGVAISRDGEDGQIDEPGDESVNELVGEPVDEAMECSSASTHLA